MDRREGTPRDLTCCELAELVMAYLDAVLSPAERVAFEAHLGACADCVVYLQSYRETVRLGRAYGGADDDRSPAMPEALVQAILAARRDKP